MKHSIPTILAAILLGCAQLTAQTVKTADLYIRDPFVLTDVQSGRYYIYRSSSIETSDGTLGGVETFWSKDLENWHGPIKVLTLSPDNWIHGRIWAPEVHAYNGRYYIFATINCDFVWKGGGQPAYQFRGTQIFWADSPEGPFRPFDILPHTPIDQMALDGTLWVENGKPYMVYCHEWVETGDGEMMLRPLKDDLSEPDGDPVRLFCASAAPWSNARTGNVTDGPFLYRTSGGKLLMMWSSFKDGSYAVGLAESTTGRVIGPWRQNEEPIFSKDGGHSMIFRTFDGRLMMVLHQPNGGGKERAHFFELEDTGTTLKLK